jgi:hypothetical protein
MREKLYFMLISDGFGDPHNCSIHTNQNNIFSYLFLFIYLLFWGNIMELYPLEKKHFVDSEQNSTNVKIEWGSWSLSVL